MTELSRNLPLYNGLGFKGEYEEALLWKKGFVKKPHVGLLFDKFLDTWGYENNGFYSQKPGKKKTDTVKRKLGSKLCYYSEIRDFYNTDCSEQRQVLAHGLKCYRQRRNDLVSALKGESLQLQTAWRLVSGLGTGHPFEAGFIWHRTLSVPYLPGSSVKGMVRAWAEQWLNVTDEVIRLFGCEEQTDKGCLLQQNTGSLIVFDALPAALPYLDIDIINCHYKEYYEATGSTRPPPADYYSPEPVFFLAVRSCMPFEFALAPRHPQDQGDLKRGLELLREALDMLGIGGKTAVGYGRMIKPDR